MKVKKIALALLCLVTLVSVTACSSSGVEKEVYDAVVLERDNAIIELDEVSDERDELAQKVKQLEEKVLLAENEVETEKEKTSGLESELSEKKKEIEALKSSYDSVDINYVEHTTNNMSSDAISFEISQEEKTVVVKFVFGMNMEDFVLVRDLIKEDHESLVKDFSSLIKDMADSFVGWTVVGILQTTDNLPIEVVVNGNLVEY